MKNYDVHIYPGREDDGTVHARIQWDKAHTFYLYATDLTVLMLRVSEAINRIEKGLV